MAAVSTFVSNALFVIVVVAYEVIAFLAARRAYWSLDADPDDSADKFMSALMSLLGGHFWPVALPVALVLWKPRKTPKQLQEENEQMKRHIADLERELGIGGRR